jgi:membrane-associated phospholipid phosphatase
MMRSSLAPFVLAASITCLLGIAVAMEPYFAGDVRAAHAVQTASPAPGWWATPISNLAPAPGKYFVMAIALIMSFFVAGWRGLAIAVVFNLLEQYGAEHTKVLFKRPRPSPDLIHVLGRPAGFSFPSTTITFFSVTFGTVGVLAALLRKAPYRFLVMAVSFGMLLLGCAARVALGLHWPSDVLVTATICLVWIWAAARSVLRA